MAAGPADIKVWRISDFLQIQSISIGRWFCLLLGCCHIGKTVTPSRVAQAFTDVLGPRLECSVRNTRDSDKATIWVNIGSHIDHQSRPRKTQPTRWPHGRLGKVPQFPGKPSGADTSVNAGRQGRICRSKRPGFGTTGRDKVRVGVFAQLDYFRFAGHPGFGDRRQHSADLIGNRVSRRFRTDTRYREWSG
jgi:hypothetical protein